MKTLTQQLKSVNVNYNKVSKTVTRDAYEKSDYNNTLRLLKRLEDKYNIDLTLYRDKLIYQNKEFNKAIKEFNKAEYKDTFDLEFTDKQLQHTIREIQELNPSTKSSLKADTIEELYATQKSNKELATDLSEYFTRITGLDTEEIDKYLYPTGEDEKSYYESLYDFLEDGLGYIDAKAMTDAEYYEHQNRKIYNIYDIIDYHVPKSEQVSARHKLKLYQSLMVTNMHAYENL